MTLANFKRPRVKNNSHLDFIRSLPCACCGNDVQTEAAHIRTGNPRFGKRSTGGAEKPSDCWAVPLCGEHHRQQHGVNEIEFWAHTGINPFVLALSLYACSGDVMTGEAVLIEQRRPRLNSTQESC